MCGPNFVRIELIVNSITNVSSGSSGCGRPADRAQASSVTPQGTARTLIRPKTYASLVVVESASGFVDHIDVSHYPGAERIDRPPQRMPQFGEFVIHARRMVG